ncbi:hypothetical protein [Catelliglobosispora koreensis]|nr:hypothetical protein [Catelliglobosispora koreensis]
MRRATFRAARPFRARVGDPPPSLVIHILLDVINRRFDHVQQDVDLA